MKVSEMNARQKKAFYNIKYAAYWHIGGLENALMDNAEDSDEYRPGRHDLRNGHHRDLPRGSLLLQQRSRQLPQGHPLLRKGLAHGAG